MTMTQERTSGAVSALVDRLIESRTEEAAAGLIAGRSLLRLRDEHLFVALGAANLRALISRDLPALDRASARLLLSVADAFSGESMLDIASIGMTRLAIIAAAPTTERQMLLTDAPNLPPAELRKMVRDSVDRAADRSLLAGVGVEAKHDIFASPPLDDRRMDAINEHFAERLVNDVRRNWTDLGRSAWGQARLIARLRDEVQPAPDAEPTTIARAIIEAAPEADLGVTDVIRALTLIARVGLVSVEVRDRVGIRALRAAAECEDDARRSAAINALTTGAVSDAESVIAMCRPPVVSRPPTPRRIDSTPHFVDDPERVSPFDILFMADPTDAGPGFPDATPEDLIEQLLLRTTRPGDLVCDLTAGIGTVGRVAADLGRTAVSIDRLDPPLNAGVIVGDARDARPPGGPFDLVVFHPPVLGETIYSERFSGTTLSGDMSAMDVAGYRDACSEAIVNAFGLTRPGGAFVLICRESRWDGNLVDWPARLSLAATKAGFNLHDRLHVVAPPASRRTVLRERGFTARRENRTINVVLSALLFLRPAPEGRRA
jgi:hypothetical protein